jgi:hypothetical protein
MLLYNEVDPFVNFNSVNHKSPCRSDMFEIKEYFQLVV